MLFEGGGGTELVTNTVAFTLKRINGCQLSNYMETIFNKLNLLTVYEESVGFPQTLGPSLGDCRPLLSLSSAFGIRSREFVSAEETTDIRKDPQKPFLWSGIDQCVQAACRSKFL